MRRTIGVWAALALSACGQPETGQSPAADAPAPGIVESGAPGPSRPKTTAADIAASAELPLPARFTALGTEPFWAAKVDGERLTYSTPENQPGESLAITRTATASAVTLRGTLAAGALRLEITAGPCSDGMSDTVYPFTVERFVGEAPESGCAKPD